MATQYFTNPGLSIWYCPTGVSFVQIECIGPGGPGASGFLSGASNFGGGGGAGGNYVKKNAYPVTQGNAYRVFVGSGFRDIDYNTSSPNSCFYYQNIEEEKNQIGSGTVLAFGGYKAIGATGASNNFYNPSAFPNYDISYVGGSGGSSLVGGPGAGGGSAGNPFGIGQSGLPGNGSIGGSGGVNSSYNGHGGMGGSSLPLTSGQAGYLYGGGGGGGASELIGGATFGNIGGTGVVFLTYNFNLNQSNNLIIDSSTSFGGKFPLSMNSALSIISNASLDIFGTERFTSNPNITIISYESLNSKLAFNSNDSISINSQQNLGVRTNSNIPLYMLGAESDNDSLNLFLKGRESISCNSGIPLYINSLGSNSGLYGFLDLFMFSSGQSSFWASPNDSINLYLEGATHDGASGNVNLFIKGENLSSYASLDLFLANSGISSYIPLYIRGSGTGSSIYNCFPSNGFLNLYLERPTCNAIPLFLLANGEPVSGNVPLYCLGGVSIYSGLDLSISGNARLENSLKLYTHGF